MDSFFGYAQPVSAFDLAGFGRAADSFDSVLHDVPVLAPTGRKIQVVVVDSDADCLRRFSQAVRGDASLQLIETASHSEAAMQCLARHRPDVMVFELGLGGAFGLALIRHCTSRSPHTEILVRTQAGDDERVLAAIEAGAAGYVYKDASAEWTVASIQALHSGGALISPGVARRVLARFHIRATGTAVTACMAASGISGFGGLYPSDPATHADASPLSEDEIGILRLVGCGTGLPEIADVLALPPRAVLAHVKRVYRQLGAQARLQNRRQ